MSIRIASLLILFALVIVPDTCMPAHAETTSISETPPIRTTAPTSTPEWVLSLLITISLIYHAKVFSRGNMFEGTSAAKRRATHGLSGLK
jgi:hypothetical protein